LRRNSVFLLEIYRESAKLKSRGAGRKRNIWMEHGLLEGANFSVAAGKKTTTLIFRL
jgi:hypothetical protein